MSAIAVRQDGETVHLIPMGWGVLDVRPITTDDVPGASLGLVEPARGGRLARPSCGCAPLIAETAVEASRWLAQHHRQQHGEEALQ